MSSESYLCNSLYLNKGYQSINTANDCAVIKSDQINSDKHLLHLTDPENKKDFYVCRGIYNYKEGTCTVNPELTKLISENSPIQQSVVQPVATPVATPAAPEANIPNFTYELLGNDTHCENDNFLIDSASNIELKDLQDKCSKNPECNAVSYVPENPNYSSKYGNLYSDCGNPKAHGGRVTYKKVDPSKVVQAKMISKGLGGCGGAPYLKADNLPEKGTIEECSNACINNTDCIKYQRSPDGTCYFMDKNSLVRTPEPSGTDNGWQCMFKSPPSY